MPHRLVDTFTGSTTLQTERGDAICPVDYELKIEQEIRVETTFGQRDTITGAFRLSGTILVKPDQRSSARVRDLANNPQVCRMVLRQRLPWDTNELFLTPLLAKTIQDGLFRIVSSPPI